MQVASLQAALAAQQAAAAAAEAGRGALLAESQEKSSHLSAWVCGQG